MAQLPHCRHVLMLGASGKLGRLVRAVWRAHPSEDTEITPVFRQDSGGPGLIWSPGDTERALPVADCVVALWGVVPGNGQDLSRNTDLALAADRVARVVGADRVIHCSSGAVYRPSDSMLSEQMPPDPQSAYGKAKAEMEHAISSLPLPGPRQIILRIGNVMGADSLGASLSGDEPVTLDQFADGQGPARSYIAASDFAHVLETLCRVDLVDDVTVLNVAAPLPTAMHEIVRAAGRTVHWRAAPETATPLVALSTRRLSGVCPLAPETADAGYLVRDAARWTGAT